MIKECQVKQKLSIISITKLSSCITWDMFFSTMVLACFEHEISKNIFKAHFGIQFLRRLWGQNLAIIHITPRWIRWGKAGTWCFSTIHLQFWGSFLSHQSIQKFWSFLKLDKLSLNLSELIFATCWEGFASIAYSNPHPIHQESETTTSLQLGHWSAIAAEFNPQVVQKPVKHLGRHHSCLSDVFFWETSRQIGLHYPDFRSISENLVVRFNML